MTIEELCEKYWPEGCAHFECDMGNYVFILAPYTDGPVEFCRSFVIDRETLPSIVSVVACVAAMHWRNAPSEPTEDFIESYKRRTKESNPLLVDIVRAWRERCKQADAAWSELAKGV